MAAKKRGLGRGLDALLSVTNEDLNEIKPNEVKTLPIDQIQRGQYQPRKEFEPGALEELASSIKAQGLIQPIVVRSVRNDKYEIIAGERRWRACQLAEMHDIPVVIRDVSDQVAMCMALIENIQREDLNPLEEAEALQRLILEFDMTHEDVADAVGRSRSSVSNLLRLMDLSSAAKQLLRSGEIEMGHARAILSLSAADQTALAKKVASQSLSVRATEKLVREMQNSKKVEKKKVAKNIDPNILNLQQELSEKLGAEVIIQHRPNGKGSLQIQYHSLDQLDGVLDRIK